MCPAHRPRPLRTDHPGAAQPPRTQCDLWRGGERDRGDVPGWVLVTLMTAGLVLALWAVAAPALTDVFSSALERVTAFGG